MDRRSKVAQEVAAEILTEFIFCKDMEDVGKSIENMYKSYNLCNDPFTGLPCSMYTYFKNEKEYERQIMAERYGHYDGLE